MINHILSATDLDWPILYRMFERADELRDITENHRGGRDYVRRLYPRRLMFYVFEEPSTRTRLSFCAAAQHLGMSVQGTDNINFSSRKKGETWQAMGRVLSGYMADVMVARTKNAGAVAELAEYAKCSVVNGGDGDNEHPTQMLVDIYTIWREFGTLEGLHIGVGGDLARGRTVHSLVKKVMGVEGVSFTFFSPPNQQLPNGIRTLLNNAGVNYKEYTHISKEKVESLDVFYHTRAQNEREGGDMGEPLVIGRDQLTWMNERLILMHPLPIGPGREISLEIEAQGALPLSKRKKGFERVRFFEQSDNGLWIRMPVLEYAMGELSPKA